MDIHGLAMGIDKFSMDIGNPWISIDDLLISKDLPMKSIHYQWTSMDYPRVSIN